MLRVLMGVMVLVCAVPAFAEDRIRPTDRVGDIYALRLTVRMAEEQAFGSSSSNDVWNFTERVVRVGEDGTELEYDLPADATPEERSADWRFPVRVLSNGSSALQLLNAEELQSRIGPWLASAGLTPDACGQMMFTWTAFRIECDPQSVISQLDRVNVRAAVLSEGADYPVVGGLRSTPMTVVSDGPGRLYSVETPVDPDYVRQQQAETDAAVAQLMPPDVDGVREPKTIAAVTGSILTTIRTDEDGQITQRQTVARIKTKGDDGVRTRVTTETLDRQRVLPD